MSVNSCSNHVKMNVRLKLPIGSLEARIYSYLQTLSSSTKELIFKALIPFYQYESLVQEEPIKEETRFAILEAIAQLQTRLLYLQEIYTKNYPPEDLDNSIIARNNSYSASGLVINNNIQLSSESVSENLPVESEPLPRIPVSSSESLFDHSLVSF